MFKGFTKGKIIAAVLATAMAGFFWNWIFPPGGSGANILLGLFVALLFIYYFAGYFGGLIDQEFFPGASKARARLYRSLDRFIKESEEHLKSIKKSRRKRRKINAKALDDFEQALLSATMVLHKVYDDWEKQAAMHEHERMLKESYNRLEDTSMVIFKLDRNWRFLYGIPSLIVALLLALLLREIIIEPFQIPSGSMIPTLLVGDHLFVSKFYYGLSKPFSKDPDFLLRWRQPKPGDVIVFKAPDYVSSHAGEAWIKRVVATEGQKIKIQNHVIYVDGHPYPHNEPESTVTYMDFIGFAGPSGGEWREQTAYRSIEKTGEVSHAIYMPIIPPTKRLGPFWPVSLDSNPPGLSCDADGCLVQKGYVFVMGDNRGNSSDSRIWGALSVSRIKGRALFTWMSVDGSGQSVQIGPFSLPRFRFERWFSWII